MRGMIASQTEMATIAHSGHLKTNEGWLWDAFVDASRPSFQYLNRGRSHYDPPTHHCRHSGYRVACVGLVEGARRIRFGPGHG
jgi:hypothetical protein